MSNSPWESENDTYSPYQPQFAAAYDHFEQIGALQQNKSSVFYANDNQYCTNDETNIDYSAKQEQNDVISPKKSAKINSFPQTKPAEYQRKYREKQRKLKENHIEQLKLALFTVSELQDEMRSMKIAFDQVKDELEQTKEQRDKLYSELNIYKEPQIIPLDGQILFPDDFNMISNDLIDIQLEDLSEEQEKAAEYCKIPGNCELFGCLKLNEN